MLGCSLGGLLQAEQISPLAKAPNWADLVRFQETMTRADFERALFTIYSDEISSKTTIKISDEAVSIKRRADRDELLSIPFLAPEDGDEDVDPEILKRFWTPAASLPKLLNGEAPLSGLHIAIDPGHIGGEWAQMEERWFQIGDKNEVKEGDITLLVANMLKPELEALGAKVTLVRDRAEPTTKTRPKLLENQARVFLIQKGVGKPDESYEDPADDRRVFSVQWQAEKLFYRTAEIRARADLVNDEIQPDLVLCIHFNAEGWGDPLNPQFVENNHLHLLVNGTYSMGELAHDDIRFEMLQRLFSRTHMEEIGLARAIAPAMAEVTGLEPYVYPGRNARLIGDDEYVYARNLLANRLFECPVIYFEPYVMNHEEVYERLGVGDYVGRTLVAGELRKSIYRDYVNGVVSGLLTYYINARSEEGIAPPELPELPNNRPETRPVEAQIPVEEGTPMPEETIPAEPSPTEISPEPQPVPALPTPLAPPVVPELTPAVPPTVPDAEVGIDQ